jgi:hypothetical protein
MQKTHLLKTTPIIQSSFLTYIVAFTSIEITQINGIIRRQTQDASYVNPSIQNLFQN